MNKLEMAHDWAMKNGNEWALETVVNAWEYADLMQEQADLRAKQEVEKQSAELRESLK
jgi:hypothetical protein